MLTARLATISPGIPGSCLRRVGTYPRSGPAYPSPRGATHRPVTVIIKQSWNICHGNRWCVVLQCIVYLLSGHDNAPLATVMSR